GVAREDARRRRRRVDDCCMQIGPIEIALGAEHPMVGVLPAASDLTAGGAGTRRLVIEVDVTRRERNQANTRDEYAAAFRVDRFVKAAPLPSAVGADVAAGPVVNDRDDRWRLHRQIGRRRHVHESHCGQRGCPKDEFVHDYPPQRPAKIYHGDCQEGCDISATGKLNRARRAADGRYKVLTPAPTYLRRTISALAGSTRTVIAYWPSARSDLVITSVLRWSQLTPAPSAGSSTKSNVVRLCARRASIAAINASIPHPVNAPTRMRG